MKRSECRKEVVSSGRVMGERCGSLEDDKSKGDLY